MKKDRSSNLLNLLLIVLSTALTLILCEVCFRNLLFSESELLVGHREPALYSNHIKNPHEDFYNDNYWKLRHLFDPSFRISEPDSLLHWAASFKKNTYRHHHAAYVGKRRPVLLFGDSFAMCVDSTDCYHEILNSDKTFKERYYFINYGVGGYGFDQIYLLMNEAVKLFEDPIVILSFLTTDLDRSMLTIRDAPKPYFVIDDQHSELILSGVPAIKSASDYISENPPEIRSYLYNRIKSIIWMPRVQEKRRRKYIDKCKALNGAIFDQAITLLDDQKLDYFMLCFQPIFHPDSDWRLEFIRDKCNEHQVPLLSQPDIRKADQRKTSYTHEKYVITGDGHPTSHGNKIVADAIWEVLQLGQEEDISRAVAAVNRRLQGTREEQVDFLVRKIRADAKWVDAVTNKEKDKSPSIVCCS